MSTYCISDIHGRMAAFNDILNQINFDCEKDKLYTLGDYTDWGPYGIRVIYKIMELNRKNKDCVVPLLGNHDMMLLDVLNTSYTDGTFSELKASADRDAYEVYRANKGDITLKEFCRLKTVNRGRIIWWLKNLATNQIVEVNGQKYYLCHSYPKLTGVSDYYVVWRRIKSSASLRLFNEEYPNHILVSGHTIVEYYCSYDSNGQCKIYKNMNYINIDCGAKALGKAQDYRLACLRLDDLAEFYSDKLD